MYKFIIPLFALAFLLVSCGKASPTPAVPNSPSASTLQFDGKILSGKHNVVLKTSKGNITLELDADAAPRTVTNFITLAKDGFYNGLLFHRVIPNFMIQGGDPNGDGSGGRSIFGDNFDDEINANAYGLDKITFGESMKGQNLPPDVAKMTLKEYFTKKGYTYSDTLPSLPMTRGAIAMANSGPNTNGSQFFIIQADKTPWLDGQHTVFGHVTSGMDVVDAIVKVPRGTGDKPLEAVTFTVDVVN